MMIDGSMQLGDTLLHARDAVGLSETAEFKATAETDCFLLVMDIPMLLP
jgi:hypothetical protein